MGGGGGNRNLLVGGGGGNRNRSSRQHHRSVDLPPRSIPAEVKTPPPNVPSRLHPLMLINTTNFHSYSVATLTNMGWHGASELPCVDENLLVGRGRGTGTQNSMATQASCPKPNGIGLVGGANRSENWWSQQG